MEASCFLTHSLKFSIFPTLAIKSASIVILLSLNAHQPIFEHLHEQKQNVHQAI
jgi:hypothetical protein